MNLARATPWAVSIAVVGSVVAVACSGSADPVTPGDTRDGGDASVPLGPDGLPLHGADGGDGGGMVEPPCEVRAVELNHVLSTGQSNSVSNGGNPHVTTTQPFANVMFDVGVMTASQCNGQGCRGYQTPSSLVPLVEGDQFFNFSVETMSSGLANQITAFAQRDGMTHSLLVSLHGRSGNTYWCLRKGGCNYASEGDGYVLPFSEGMRQVTDAKRLAEAQGKSYVVRSVTAIHGESDHYSNESEFDSLTTSDGSGRRLTGYAEALAEWQRDYEAQVRAITGQAEAVPLFVSQMSTWTDRPASRLANRQLEAHVGARGKVILVGPGYPLPFASDCLHYTPHGQRWLGAYFAKAYASTVLKCKPFEPLRPLSIRREGSDAIVKFVVPVPPLAFDTTRVAAAPNMGFTYQDDAGSAQIVDVAIVSADEVRVRFNAAPSGANRTLRYAQNAVAGGTCPGPTNGARGNLRDSDATVSHHTNANGQPYALYNWAVHFDLTVP